MSPWLSPICDSSAFRIVPFSIPRAIWVLRVCAILFSSLVLPICCRFGWSKELIRFQGRDLTSRTCYRSYWTFQEWGTSPYTGTMSAIDAPWSSLLQEQPDRLLRFSFPHKISWICFPFPYSVWWTCVKWRILRRVPRLRPISSSKCCPFLQDL